MFPIVLLKKPVGLASDSGAIVAIPLLFDCSLFFLDLTHTRRGNIKNAKTIHFLNISKIVIIKSVTFILLIFDCEIHINQRKPKTKDDL